MNGAIERLCVRLRQASNIPLRHRMVKAASPSSRGFKMFSLMLKCLRQLYNLIKTFSDQRLGRHSWHCAKMAALFRARHLFDCFAPVEDMSFPLPTSLIVTVKETEMMQNASQCPQQS